VSKRRSGAPSDRQTVGSVKGFGARSQPWERVSGPWEREGETPSRSALHFLWRRRRLCLACARVSRSPMYERRPYIARRIQRRLRRHSMVLVPVGLLGLAFTMWIDAGVRREGARATSAVERSWQVRDFGPDGRFRPTYEAWRVGGVVLFVIGALEAAASAAIVPWLARARARGGDGGCPECSHPVSARDEFCGACGRQLRCIGCGHLRASSEGGCPECGGPAASPFRR
jgi:hypothetical protein